MIRVIKPEGFGNIRLQEAPIPEITERQVLVRTEATLISRGSELFRRYIKEEEVPQRTMGYSLAGSIERVGAAVTEYRVGQRVFVTAPHAQYAVGEVDSTEGRLVALPEGVSCEQGTLLRLATEATAWAASSGARQGDTIVILGQGVVGCLMLQILRGYRPARIVTVDPLPLRQGMSRELGADLVIDPAQEDPVAAVQRLTGGTGADLVIDCVGGYDGVRSFEQAQDMVRRRGTIQLIAAYQQRPLPLHTLKIMHRRLVAGILVDEPLSTDRRARRRHDRARRDPGRAHDHSPLPVHQGQGSVRLPVALAAGGTRRAAHLARVERITRQSQQRFRRRRRAAWRLLDANAVRK